jgi:hypothetical protein
VRFALLCIQVLPDVMAYSLIHKYRRFGRTLVSTRHRKTDDHYQHNVQSIAKLHVSPGLTEFPDVTFNSITSNSVRSDSNLYRKNDVVRGYVQFIRTNLVINP